MNIIIDKGDYMFRTLAAAALFASIAFSGISFAAEAPLTKSDVEKIVKETILNNPETIIEALKRYQDKQAADQKEAGAKALKESKKDIFEDPNSPVAGNPKGDVTLVEFYDYHCGYCKKVLPTVAQLIKDDAKLRVVLKDYPILSQDSELAGKASMAFYKLNPKKHFEYHTALMGMSGAYDADKLTEAAKKLGVDEAKFRKELESPEIAKEIAKNRDLAIKLGIRGTPAFIVGDTIVPGAADLDELKKMIAEARKK